MDPENNLTQVSSVESTSSNSSDSSKLEQKSDFVAAGKGEGGKLHIGINSLTAEGGTGYGAEMTLAQLLFLRKKVGGDVTFGGGVGLGAKVPGVNAEMEEEKALQKEGRKA